PPSLRGRRATGCQPSRHSGAGEPFTLSGLPTFGSVWSRLRIKTSDLGRNVPGTKSSPLIGSLRQTRVQKSTLPIRLFHGSVFTCPLPPRVGDAGLEQSLDQLCKPFPFA